MRLLTAVGIVDEVAENTYKPNAITQFMNKPGLIGAEKHQLGPISLMPGHLSLPSHVQNPKSP